MSTDNTVYSIFLIFTGTAILSTLVLYTRQSLLVAYILLGMILGPCGLKLVADTHLITHIGEVGIIFLLFLLGLHLHPQDLWNMLRKVTLVSVISSVIFAAMGYGVGRIFGYTVTESIVIGAAMMFSSTIIGLKLLPTTILHHQHIGEVMIGILLMQDLIAIVVLLLLNTATSGMGFTWSHTITMSLALPALCFIAFVVERFILTKLLARFDQVQEYIFILAIGWCLGMAHLAKIIGLSEDIGAFIAGVSVAAGPIALYIAENLKPLRDFFLVLFFFSIGASFDFSYLSLVIIPALILGMLVLLAKPYLYQFLLRYTGERSRVGKEVGLRLGQSSEFSLLVAHMAASSSTVTLISNKTNYLIQAMTIITFIVSCYVVVLLYPTPLALTERLRRD
ncbi:MAG: Iron transporter MagA [Legionellaceae bacterium]